MLLNSIGINIGVLTLYSSVGISNLPLFILVLDINIVSDYLMFGRVDIGVSIVDVTKLVLEMVLGPLGHTSWQCRCRCRCCNWSPHWGRQQVVVVRVVSKVSIVGISIGIVVSWLISSIAWVVS